MCGLFCTFLLKNQLLYNFLGFIFSNEKCSHKFKKEQLGLRQDRVQGFLVDWV